MYVSEPIGSGQQSEALVQTILVVEFEWLSVPNFIFHSASFPCCPFLPILAIISLSSFPDILSLLSFLSYPPHPFLVGLAFKSKYFPRHLFL